MNKEVMRDGDICDVIVEKRGKKNAYDTHIAKQTSGAVLFQGVEVDTKKHSVGINFWIPKSVIAQSIRNEGPAIRTIGGREFPVTKWSIELPGWFDLTIKVS